MKLLPAFLFCTAAFSLSTNSFAIANDPVADAKKLCQYQASEKSGYKPGNTQDNNTVAKGAGAGAVGGTAVRAIQGKSLLKGAAIGAGVGAAGGVMKKNRNKKQAVLNESHYKSEYENCMRKRGFKPENVK